MPSIIGFGDGRNLAELALSPAKPLSRTLAKFGSLKLNIGGKGGTPGTISKASDIHGAMRATFGRIIKGKKAATALAATLAATLSAYDQFRNVAEAGTLVTGDPIFTGNTTGIPTPSKFLEFSNLKPGEPVPSGFGPLLDSRKTQLAALQQRTSSIFAADVFKGISVSEDLDKTPFPLDTQLDRPSFPALALGGAAAAKDSVLKDKRRFAIIGVNIGAGKPTVWSRLLSKAQVKSIPTLNPVVNQVFKDKRNTSTWNEPVSPFVGEYPYNRVTETASGHVFEWDDTPGAERVHIFHRSGSFIEWHPDGTVVYKNLKDGYDLTMGDKFVKVNGSCHISVDGNVTLHAKGNVDMQTDGEMNVHAKKDFNVYADSINLRAKKLFKADGTRLDLRYIQLPTSLIPIPMSAGFAPRINLGAIKADYPKSNIIPALQAMAKNPLDPKNASIVINLNPETVAIPPENPLSNPGIYLKKSATAVAYRARMFDAPEEADDIELYSAHVGLQQALGDYTGDPRTLGGDLYDLEGASITTDQKTPSVNYLNFDDFKGKFGYANSFQLGGTSFKLEDLVDIAIYPEVVAPLKPIPLPPVDTSIPTITPTDPRGGSGGGSGSGGSGGSGGGANLPNYFSFVKARWNELNALPQQGADYDTRHQNGAKFLRIVAYEIYSGLNGATKDTRIGLWQKRGPNTVNDRDADKLVFLLNNGTVAFVDIITSSGDPDCAPSWQGPEIEDGDAAAGPIPEQGWVAPEPEPGVHI